MQIGRGQWNYTSNLLMGRIYGNIERERERIGWVGQLCWQFVAMENGYAFIHIDLS